jgi:hypothetical protein
VPGRVLYSLGCGKESGVKCRRTLVFLHNLRALIGDSDKRGAGFSFRLLLNDGEHLFQTLHLAFGLTALHAEKQLFCQRWSSRLVSRS